MVLFARGLRDISRIHLVMGIFGYLASPLWLLFLLTFNWALWYKGHTGLSEIVVRSRTPFIELTGSQHAFLIFVICMSVLFLPKVLALIDLALDRARWRKPFFPLSTRRCRCCGIRPSSPPSCWGRA
jgi:membrane glycosyltransferase